MVDPPVSLSPAIAQADAWGNANARFLLEVFARWQVDRAWPDAEDLGRQGLRERWDFDAFELADTIPAPLGRHERGADDRIILRLRALSFIPPAWPLVQDVVRVIIYAAKLYVEEPGKPQLRSRQLAELLALDSRRAAEISELLLNERWMFGSGGGDHDGEWWRELHSSCRYLIGVTSPADYFRVEDERNWANYGVPTNPLLDLPIGDAMPVLSPRSPVHAVSPGATVVAPHPRQSAEREQPAATSATDEVPSVFISYAHEDKDLARALADGLEAAGLRVWIDDNELLAGDSIIEQIAQAVADIDFFCALVSDASRESKWCQKELSLAMTSGLIREGAKVIPLRVGDVAMPDSIIDKLYVPLDADDVSATVERIVRDVYRHRARRRQLGDKAATQQAARETEALALGEAVTLPASGEATGTDMTVADAIERALNAHVAVAAKDLLNRDEDVTIAELRSWAATTGITVRTYCGESWELSFLAEGRGRGLSARDELNAKLYFIRNELVDKLRRGWFNAGPRG